MAQYKSHYYYRYYYYYYYYYYTTQDMQSRGTTTDIARAIGGISHRCRDLLKLDVDDLRQTALRTATVSFRPSPLHKQLDTAKEIDNVVGQLNVSEDWADVTLRRPVRDRVTQETWSVFDADENDGRLADEGNVIILIIQLCWC